MKRSVMRNSLDTPMVGVSRKGCMPLILLVPEVLVTQPFLGHQSQKGSSIVPEALRFCPTFFKVVSS